MDNPRLQQKSGMTTPPPASAPAGIFANSTALVHCLQNVVSALLLERFLEIGMFYPLVAAKNVESWKGLVFSMFYCMLVFAMILAFKDTLEALILFENFKRHRDGKKEASTTTVAVDKTCAVVQHVDHGSTNTAWQAVTGLALHTFMNTAKPDATSADASTTKSEKEEDAKAAAGSSSDDDAIKQDAASASSSVRSSADTSDALA